jgi:hypothetical protein
MSNRMVQVRRRRQMKIMTFPRWQLDAMDAAIANNSTTVILPRAGSDVWLVGRTKARAKFYPRAYHWR